MNSNLIEIYNVLVNIEKSKYPTEKYPIIKDIDYKNGFIYRYFIRQSNSKNHPIIEIDNKQWNQFKNNKMYVTVKTKWYISGNREYVYNSNLRLITEADKKLPGIKDLLENNLLQFYKT